MGILLFDNSYSNIYKQYLYHIALHVLLSTLFSIQECYSLLSQGTYLHVLQ